MRPVLALLLALSLATAAPLPFPREIRNPALKKLQGEWFVVNLAVDGVSTHYGTSGPSPPLMAVLLQNRLTFRRGDVRIAEWSVSLSAEEREGRIDLQRTGQVRDVKEEMLDPWSPKLLAPVKDGRGIFRLRGDYLFFIFVPMASADPLPRSFDGVKGRELLVILQRKAP